MKPFERVLKLGDEGELVSDLQARLIELGFKTCYVEAGLPAEGIKAETMEAPSGYFGEITQGCLEDFQAKALGVITEKSIGLPVEIDLQKAVTGEMDANTHYVLANFERLAKQFETTIEGEEEPEKEPEKPEEPPAKELIKKVIELAKGEIGVKEVGGNNYGKRVVEYQKTGSDGAAAGGQPWCQYFMNWLVITACKELGTDYKGNYSGYTPYWIDFGKKNKIAAINPKIENVEIGDFMYVYSSARKSAKHVALVIGKKGNTVITIEGNTNDGGGADGFGVFKRQRPCPWAVVKWHKMYE